MSATMKKTYLAIVLALNVLRVGISSAAVPEWGVDPSEYAKQISVVGVLSLNDEETGAGNKVGAFVGATCRGSAQPLQVSGTWLYFLTVYSNTENDTVGFRAYIANQDTVLNIVETLVFTTGTVYGSPNAPFQWHALLDYDFPPEVGDIPDQLIEIGGNFTTFDLDDSLTLNDDDPIAWTYSGNSNLNVSIDVQNVVSITPVNAQWIGSEIITFTATDQTANGKSDSDDALFTILDVDHAPVVGEIEDQYTRSDGTFDSFDLDDYLTESDGDSIAWSHWFSASDRGESPPIWSVNPSDYKGSMTVIAEVFVRGRWADTSDYILGAFSGDVCRGVGTLVDLSGSKAFWMFVYGNIGDGTITFKLYDPVAREVVGVYETVDYVQDSRYGLPGSPEILHAGHIIIQMDDEHVATPIIVDDQWAGIETVFFRAQDQGTLYEYSDTTNAVALHTMAIWGVSPPSGPKTGGTSVTLTGSEFGGSQATGRVTFGGTEAVSYVGWFDTEIVCVTPPHAAGTVDVMVTSAFGLIATKSSAFTFTNQPPVAVDDAYSVNEDNPLTAAAPGVLGNDSDPDGDALTAVLVSGPSHGALTNWEGDGSFTYTPTPNFNGTDSFTYHANDSIDDSNVATVTITVNPMPDAPVAEDDGYSVDEDGTLNVGAPGVLGNDSDPDGDPLTAVLESGPSHGTLTLNGDGSFTYTPNASFFGTDSFTYRANDGTIASDPATVTITVNALPPVAAFSGSPRSGDQPLTVQFTDETTGHITSWSWTFGDGGIGSVQNPSHTYTAAGTYTVRLTVTGPGGEDFEEKAGYIAVSEGGGGGGGPTADFTGSPTSGPAPLTVQFTDQSDGSITSWFWSFGDGRISTQQNPSHTYTTVDTFTVRLTVYPNLEGPGGSDTKMEWNYIKVRANAHPEITSVPDTTAFEDSVYTYDVEATDPDGHTLTYSLTVKPDWLSIDSTTGLISGTPTNTDVGDTTVTVSVEDGYGGVVDQTYTLSVLNTNDPPVIISIPDTTAFEDALYTYQVQATDVDEGDSLSYSLVVKPPWLAIDSVTGLIRGTPENEHVGDVPVTVQVSDLEGATGSQTYTVRIGNTAPSVTDVVLGPSSPVTGDTLVVSYTYVDADGDGEDGTEIRWVRDGVLVSEYNDSTHVSPDSTAKGEAWYCTIRPKDGTDFGEVALSDTVAIGNSAPAAPVIRIVPKPAYTTNDLRVVLVVGSVDPDGDDVKYRRQWYKDGVVQAGVTGSTVYASSTSEGQLWQCVMTPNDGMMDGGSASDSVRIIGKSAPVFEGLRVLVVRGNDTIQDSTVQAEEQTVTVRGVDLWDTLTFQVQASDADGDSLWCAADSLPSGAVFDETTWTFVWRPEEGQEAEEGEHDPHRAVFSISDQEDTTVQAVVEVYVEVPIGLRMVREPEAIEITDWEAVVWWKTNMVSTSWVDYGLEPGYGLQTGSPDPVTEHRVRLTNLWPDTTYYVRVHSVSAPDTVWGWTTFRTMVDTVAPAAPSGLWGERVDERVVLGWSANEEEDVVGYHVYRREVEGAFGVIATLVSGLGYVDAGVVEGKVYGYCITAVDGSANESDASEEVVLALECSGDFNGDGKVFTEDFVLFVDHFGLREGDAGYESKYDLNGDGKVFTEDFVLFVDLFGSMCPVTAKALGAFSFGFAQEKRLGKNEGVRVVWEVGEEEASSVSEWDEGGKEGKEGKEGMVYVSYGAEEIVLDVYAEGVTELKGYGITLRYDPKTLLLLSAEPEHTDTPHPGEDACNLLNREGGKTPLFFVKEDAQEAGRIWLANSLVGSVAVSGSGLLAHLRFEVIGALKHSFVVRVEALDLLDMDLHWNGVEHLRDLEVKVVPRVYTLGQNFPNPFNSFTRMEYQLPREEKVALSIYNVLGQEVRTLVEGRQGAGFYAVRWDGRDGMEREVGSGVYLYRLKAGTFTETRKALLLR